MVGEILLYIPKKGFGTIKGSDGVGYHFDKQDLNSIIKEGDKVEFQIVESRLNGLLSCREFRAEKVIKLKG
jgi:cold shock CspA family protein